MEGHIFNATIIRRKQERFARSVSHGRKNDNWENKVGKMNTAEFLWMSGGAAAIGAGIYILSFVMM